MNNYIEENYIKENEEYSINDLYNDLKSNDEVVMNTMNQ